jgi:hypothetical protein
VKEKSSMVMFALLKLPPGRRSVDNRVALAGESEASARMDARTRVLMRMDLSKVPFRTGTRGSKITRRELRNAIFFFKPGADEPRGLLAYDSVAVTAEAEDARFFALSEREARMAHWHQIAGIDMSHALWRGHNWPEAGCVSQPLGPSKNPIGPSPEAVNRAWAASVFSEAPPSRAWLFPQALPVVGVVHPVNRAWFSSPIWAFVPSLFLPISSAFPEILPPFGVLGVAHPASVTWSLRFAMPWPSSFFAVTYSSEWAGKWSLDCGVAQPERMAISESGRAF